MEKYLAKVAVFNPQVVASSAENEWAIVLVKGTPIILCDNPIRGSVRDWHEIAFFDYHHFPLSMFIEDEEKFYTVDKQAPNIVINDYIHSYRNLMDMLELAYERDESNRSIYEQAIGLFNKRIESYKEAFK